MLPWKKAPFQSKRLYALLFICALLRLQLSQSADVFVDGIEISAVTLFRFGFSNFKINCASFSPSESLRINNLRSQLFPQKLCTENSSESANGLFYKSCGGRRYTNAGLGLCFFDRSEVE